MVLMDGDWMWLTMWDILSGKTGVNWVRSINPQAYMTAELVDPIEKTRPYLSGDEFDATMNYNFAFIVHDFFVQDTTASTVTQFDARLKGIERSVWHRCCF